MRPARAPIRVGAVVARLDSLLRQLQIEWIDVLLALGLSVLALFIGPGLEAPENFSPAVLLCTAPLLVRRRWPIPVLALAVIGFFLAGNGTNLAALVGGLVAAVSVGLDERRPIIGGVAAFAAAVAIA